MGGSICMKKHPISFKLTKELDPPLESTKEERILYKGPLRELVDLAPNNVNTMACFALASNIGFDKIEVKI